MALAVAFSQALALSVGLGLAVTALAPAKSWPALQRWALAPAIGWSLLSLMCGTLVMHGPAVRVWARPVVTGLWVLAGSSVFCHRRLTPATPMERSRLRRLQGCTLVIASAWLLVATVGGPNLNLFRSNKWDRFNYDALALSMDAFASNDLRKADIKDLAAMDPAFVLVKESLINDRIGVGGTLAFISRIGGVRPADLGYYFGMLGVVLAFPGLVWLAWRGGATYPWALALAAAASTGFWARFIQDVDVLGQCQAMPMAGLFGVGLVLLPRPLGVLALAFSVAGLMGTYPLYLPLLAGGSVIWLALVFARRAQLRQPILAAVGGAIALSLVLGAGVVAEAWHQLTVQGKWVAATSVNWERYHYPWIIDPPSPWRWFVGFWGVQPVDHYWGLYWGMGWALTFLIAAAAWAVVRRRTRYSAASSASLLAMGLALAAVLALRGRPYTACRGLAYVYAFAIVTLPTGWLAMRGRWRVVFQFLVAAWAVIQFGSSLKGVKQVFKGEPATLSFLWQPRDLDYRWEGLEEDIRRLDPRLLALDIEKPWVLERAQQVFGYRPWWSPQPIPQYHEIPRQDVLSMPAPAFEPDLALIEKSRLPASLKGKPPLAETPELAVVKWADLKAARAAQKKRP